MRDCHISSETNTAEACHPTGWLWHTCQYPTIVHHKLRIWGWGSRWRLASGTYRWFLRRARASRFRTWWSISGMTCFQAGRSSQQLPASTLLPHRWLESRRWWKVSKRFSVWAPVVASIVLPLNWSCLSAVPVYLWDDYPIFLCGQGAP